MIASEARYISEVGKRLSGAGQSVLDEFRRSIANAAAAGNTMTWVYVAIADAVNGWYPFKAVSITSDEREEICSILRDEGYTVTNVPAKPQPHMPTVPAHTVVEW